MVQGQHLSPMTDAYGLPCAKGGEETNEKHQKVEVNT